MKGMRGFQSKHWGWWYLSIGVGFLLLAIVNSLQHARLAGEVGARAFPDVDALLTEGLDAAYVCVPPFAHGVAERAVVAAGLPLFVEKPVGLDMAIPSDISALIAERGVLSAVGHHWRYLAVVEQARTAGILGSTALVQGGAFASLTGTGDISSGFDDTNIYGGLLGNEAGEMNGGFGFGRGSALGVGVAAPIGAGRSGVVSVKPGACGVPRPCGR